MMISACVERSDDRLAAGRGVEGNLARMLLTAFGFPKTTVIFRRFPSPTTIFNFNRSETHSPSNQQLADPLPNTPKPISAPLYRLNHAACTAA